MNDSEQGSFQQRDSFRKDLARDLSQGEEYRESYAESFANEYLATQIQMLRKQRGLTQAQLGERIGSNQGRVSVYEDENYGKWSLDTLRKLAGEFGLWLKLSFESYGELVHEVSHFSPDSLLRDSFSVDPGMRKLLEDPAHSSFHSETHGLVNQWASSAEQDLTALTQWLQGLRLPDFDVREVTPAQHLLRNVPRSDVRAWNAIASGVSRLLSTPNEEIAPLLRHPSPFWSNLFHLAAAIGPRADLQEGLDLAYENADARFGRDGVSGFDAEGEGGLINAMLENQLDDRWKPLWYGYLNGRTHSEMLGVRGHPFLPGKLAMGIRGLLGRNEAIGDYWHELARGVLQVERRFIEQGHGLPGSTPNIVDELIAIMEVIFTRKPEPETARRLFKASLDLAYGKQHEEGGWSMDSASAWAVAVERRQNWKEALWAIDDSDKSAYVDTIAAGLQYYSDWQNARPVKDTVPATLIQSVQWASGLAKAA